MTLTSTHWWHLVKAVSLYQSLGYKEIAVPWHARQEAIEITLPPTTRSSVLEAGPGKRLILVGSAEQALLDLSISGELPLGVPLVCMTPCFRLPDEGPLHHPYFVKVELGCFWSQEVWPCWNDVECMARKLQKDARKVHQDLLELSPELGAPGSLLQGARAAGHLVEIPLEDLEINGVEVGSYGIRSWESSTLKTRLIWAYGTGMAMPRAQEALKHLKVNT